MNVHTWDFTPATKEVLRIGVEERHEPGRILRTVHIAGHPDIVYEIESAVSLPPLENLDFAVIATIFLAMRRGQPLYVEGAVSRSLLANIEEFQEVWSNWMPERYRVVPVSAAVETDQAPENTEKGVFAFSGGVDATFSLLLHHKRHVGRRTLEPAVAVLAHGLDIPLPNKAAFSAARDQAGKVLESIGTPLATIRTNWRDICYDWEMEHGAGVVACLANFSALGATGVVGGDEGYEWINIPWGSTPITNGLLSSGSFAIRTEAMGHSRAERVAYIAGQSDMAGSLRVCWKNVEGLMNCGVCEKCIRTQINLLAAGVAPKGFAQRAGFVRIALYTGKDADAVYFLRDSLRTAARRGVGGPWRYAARIAIVKNWLLNPWFILCNRLKRLIRSNERLYWAVRKRILGKDT